MNQELLSNIGGYQVLLPLSHFVASWILSRIFALPFWICLFVGLIPGLALFFEVPFSEELRAEHPGVVLGGGWVLVTALALVYRLGAVIVGFLSIGSGSASAVFSLVLVTTLGFSTLLLLKPDFLREGSGNWQNGFALFLFTASVLGLIVACFRFLRAGLVLLFWGFGVFVLGSETFLRTVPPSSLAKELSLPAAFVPQSIMSDFVDSLELGTVTDAVTGSAEGSADDSARGGSRGQQPSVKVAVFDTSGYLPADSRIGATYQDYLQMLLNARSEEKSFEVKSYALGGLGMLQLAEMVKTQMKREVPEVVVISGWQSDSVPGANEFGLPGLSEMEALDLVETRRWLSSLPLVESLLNSKMIRLFFDPAEIGLPAHRTAVPPRLSPSEYSKYARYVVEEVKNAGSLPVLLHRPLASASEQEASYRLALEEAAKETSAIFVDPTPEFVRLGYGKMFSSVETYSPKGHRLIADSIVEAIRHKKFARLPVVHQEIVPDSQTGGDLLFEVAAEKDYSGYYRVHLKSNNLFVSDKRLYSGDPVLLRFRLPAQDRAKPFVNLELSATKDSATDAETLVVPYWLRTRSVAEGSRKGIVFESERFEIASWDTSASDAGLLVIDHETGAVAKRIDFSFSSLQIEERGWEDALSAAIHGVDWGDFVLIATRPLPEGFHAQKIENALKYLGIESLPKRGERFVAVSTAGREVKPIVSMGESTQIAEVKSLERLPIQVVSRKSVAHQPRQDQQEDRGDERSSEEMTLDRG